MLNQLLPRQVDNSYRGSKVALWVFAVLVFLKVMIGLNSILNARHIASSADGIPLDTFTAAGAQTVVSLFALLGLAGLILGLLSVVLLARYRALVPFMFALFLVEFLGRRLILRILPIPRAGTPPGYAVNLILLSLMVVGLALSLWRRREEKPQSL